MRNLAIFLFTILVLSADLKVIISPYIHWVCWLLLIFPFIMLDMLFKGLVKNQIIYIIFSIFLLGCLFNLIFISDIETLVQITKFTLIFLTLYYFAFYNKNIWDPFFKAINFSVYINSFLLFLGLFGIPVAKLMTSDGRWGTFLAFPGSLVKIGILGFYLNIFVFLLIKEKRKHALILLGLSLFIIQMDGSRTGMLILLLTLFIIPILYFLINYQNFVKSIVVLFSLFISITLCILILFPYLSNTRLGENIINLINSDSIAEGFNNIDPARYMMIQTAIEKINKNPFFGTGALTTVGIYEDGSSMVVHNTYLQIWGDYGFISFISYIFIILGWILFLPKIFYKLQTYNDNFFNVKVCSSILILNYYILNGLFHPYSTELSEWILFIVPFSLIYELYKQSVTICKK